MSYNHYVNPTLQKFRGKYKADDAITFPFPPSTLSFSGGRVKEGVIMSLKKILARITDDAQREVDRITERATSNANEIIREAEEDAEIVKSESIQSAEEEAAQRKERLVATARLDIRKRILDEKQRAIGVLFQKAIETLCKLEDDEYRALMKRMLLSGVQTGEEEIILSQRDKTRLTQSFLDELNEELRGNGKKSNLTISPATREMSGGFVLRRGNIELNSAFESLFESFRDELELEVGRLLFESTTPPDDSQNQKGLAE